MVRFVNLDGKPKQFRRQMAEIHFDIKPDSVGEYAQFYEFTGMKEALCAKEIGHWNENYFPAGQTRMRVQTLALVWPETLMRSQ